MYDSLSRCEVEDVNVMLLMGTIPSSDAPETSRVSAQAIMKLHIFIFLIITSIV